MARVDFYVLSDSGDRVRQIFACRLTEKAYRLDTRVHIVTADDSAARSFDELLWTFRDGSFVPHEITALDRSAIEAPVTIGPACPADPAPGLVINLGEDLPDDADRYGRIAEIVAADDDSRQSSRQRYARYRDLGHTLETHKL